MNVFYSGEGQWYGSGSSLNTPTFVEWAQPLSKHHYNILARQALDWFVVVIISLILPHSSDEPRAQFPPSPSLSLPLAVACRNVCIFADKTIQKLYVNQQMLGISDGLPGIFQVRSRIQTDFFVMSCKSLCVFVVVVVCCSGHRWRKSD